MRSDFEEGEYRGPLFNQLEKGSHLIWEPGQVFEKQIGVDRASLCLNDYLWNLHGYSSALGGSVLRGKSFGYIWGTSKPNKVLPDFSLNLFIQAKRADYSSQSNSHLHPYIKGEYWHFEITSHQQLALEQLEVELGSNSLVVYAAPVFHRQQELYNHTSNQTIVNNSTFPKASSLKGHSKWYYDRAGTSGVANPEFDYIEGNDLLGSIEAERREKGDFNKSNMIENLQKLSKSIRNVVESQSDSFRASQFAFQNDLIDTYLENWQIGATNGVKDFMQVEAFNYLWKLQWLTY